MGTLQTLTETRKKQVTEKRSAEEFDAEIAEVGAEGFSVRIQRKVFTAEAVEGADGKTLSFGEESEVEEFSAGFVERHYLDLLPDAWKVLQELLETEAVSATAPRIETPSLTVALQDTVPRVPSEAVVQPVTALVTRSDVAVDERRASPYELFERDAAPLVYEPEVPATQEPVRAAVYAAPLTAAEQEPEQDRWAIAYEQETDTVQPGTQARERNAVDVVQALFEETGVQGTIGEASGYGVTEDFDGDLPESTYWVDIDGMDMDRTEYFINGELAEDSIDQYDLGPGDSITFVESDVFYSEETGVASCSADETLHLADLRRDEIDAIEGYRVPEIPSLGDVAEAYTAPAA